MSRTETKPPAVVIIARHGMRLDAADQSWHLSTPTPYDPPLTYGGWNQCRALGVRIASLLHAREQEQSVGDGSRKRKRKHKVVIHTSPFLRCLQTSVAISAGMAQYEPPKEMPRTPATMHSASPKLRAKDAPKSPHLRPITEPSHDFARDRARRALDGHSQKKYRRSKIRVDAFLGEWLNPGYFDQITPPPPSPMMVAGAKAELMQNDPLDNYTPTLSHKSSKSSLWGATNSRPSASRETTLDDWSHVRDALDVPTGHRSRSNSVSSAGSNESSGRKSPFRAQHALHALTSRVPPPGPENAIYHPPIPSYAISNSDNIPRGYVTHARNATVHVDYQWDSSRPPQDWGGGGNYGEEWSSMHRRFRRGLNSLMQWYSQHNADDRAEDALGIEQADKHHEEEDEEELVVILVTHGAGSNALIGALTNQPVLLDVGMASLTMAVRKDDAPGLLSPPSSNPGSPSPTGTPCSSPDPIKMMNGSGRRSSLDIGLSAIYDMRLVSSSEHLRPGVDPTKATSSTISNMRGAQEALARYKQFGSLPHAPAGVGAEVTLNLQNPSGRKSNPSAALGSMRRPSASSIPQRLPSPANFPRPSAMEPEDKLPATTGLWTPPGTVSPGLWTPPSGSTPRLDAQRMKDEKNAIFSKLNETNGRTSPGHKMLKFANSPPDSRRNSSNARGRPSQANGDQKPEPKQQDSVLAESEDGVSELPLKVGEAPPQSLSRGLSVKALWGKQASGDRVVRRFDPTPKRRWTVNQNDGHVEYYEA
ncbi:hypothetical protein CLAFUW4_04381 [Fulvia fulva]|uniref:Phosphoglycerate mutase family protein n=1 Tax=Passalora fulva TaxID=5499 RepID=A0A9Q8P7S5_PASFU|nr:uncharacterized protein CLAFUR5_04345 [Fulvia fulva]KAK4626801.1 hypothetical protein CLAFUR4_04367 [Fulvia fulva]UJO16424.1 hypothetical protein CLAFUR5_04345 [Fulvia fulva]WPV14160.1 hypothetical protein CLAFUW4_04381 [Fulvia fulva]WPV28432.1 hypothetical protein CLAFUW7_04371 [Fulvia fulva]